MHRAITARRSHCADRGRVVLAEHRVRERALQVEVERVAELVRLRRLFPLAAAAMAVDPVPAEGVTLEAREQVVEDLLADLPGATRRELEPVPVPGQVAGLLESSCQVIEAVEIPDRVVTHEIADLVAIDRCEVAR